MLVSAIGFIASFLQIKHAREKLEHEMTQKYSGLVYENRIKLYPQAYSITSHLIQAKKPQLLPPYKEMKNINDQLNAWAGEAGLFMSRDGRKAYWELRAAINKNPSSGEFYSEQQAKKIWRARNCFRRELRNDVGNLYMQDDNYEEREFWDAM